MSIHIVREAWVEETTSHYRVFAILGRDGCAYEFPCDAQGNVDLPPTSPARGNYEACCSGRLEVRDEGVRTYVSHYRHPRTGLCPCGEEVELSRFTNTCGCGRDYNMSGGELAPREQWGEETGESYLDVLQADTDPWGDQ